MRSYWRRVAPDSNRTGVPREEKGHGVRHTQGECHVKMAMQ